MKTLVRPLGVVLCVALLAQAAEAQRSPTHRKRSSRGAQHQGQSNHHGNPRVAAVFPFELRTIDGHGNNVANPDWGTPDAHFVRRFLSDYGDGSGTPAGADRPSPRTVSNTVSAQTGSIPNGQGASDFVWQWGQFLDHDLDETPLADPREPFDIPVPTGDPFFDSTGSGTATIPLDRSAYEVIEGVREQVNFITAFVDASNVYGSESDRAHWLRTNDGTGRLRVSAGDLLPYNTDGLPNAPSESPAFFLAGDIRANEQVGLTAMHTLFVREHNALADVFRLTYPTLSGDLIYEVARAIVVAEMQAITYEEFLPVLLGPGAIGPYAGYRDDIDAGIANVFAAAAYRVGHTMLSPQILRLTATGDHPDGHLPLQDAFFTPSTLVATGIDPILRGLAAQAAQAVDPFVVDDVRNFLFGPPGSGGFDLVSLNIQRGRDHGIPSYARLRRRTGGTRVHQFTDINPDPVISGRLAAAYGHPTDIDAWVGLLAEPPVAGGMVGATLKVILTDQFRRLRAGDRFWYEAYLPPSWVSFIKTQKLSAIIRRNTDIGAELPTNVFRLP